MPRNVYLLLVALISRRSGLGRFDPVAPQGAEKDARTRLTEVAAIKTSPTLEVYSTRYVYDAAGRVKESMQTTAGQPQPFQFTYSYNADDTLESITYPSGRRATTCYDEQGRAKWLSGSTATLNCADPQGPSGSYVTSAAYSYTAVGLETALTLGNGLVETRKQNYRGQVTGIGLGSLWTLTNDYGTGSNNGNVLVQTLTTPELSLYQKYRYDKVNRLELASEFTTNAPLTVCPDPGSVWCQAYGYDRYGNRTVTARWGLASSPSEPSSFSNTNNRVTDANWGYIDGRGNVTAMPFGTGVETLSYDAEDRLKSKLVGGVEQVTFTYDGEGRRVKQTVGGVELVYVYNAMGELAAEYGGTAVGGTQYVTTDHLGSTRLVKSPGTPELVRLDYLPFGEEITVSQGNPRYGVPGYGSTSPLAQKFTGKERDAETGLDYFGARYMSSAQGRFTTADPLMASAHVSDPQSWNRYTYARNNPLRYVDPDGLEVPPDCAKDNKCTIVVKVNVVYDGSANNGKGLNGDQKKKFEQGQIAKAQKEYGTSNIKLDVSYTPGEVTRGADGKTYISGLKSDSLNVVVRDRGGNSADVDLKSDLAVSFININDAHNGTLWPLWTNTTSHELGHQFLGDPYREWNPWSYTFYREPLVDAKVGEQVLGTSQPRFRDGLEKRRYAAPLNPEANKPR